MTIARQQAERVVAEFKAKFNLETVVERARQCRAWRARQGARTQRADARKKEHRRMVRRARSVVTQKVNVIEARMSMFMWLYENK
ncbi:MAG: hypothetical protein LBQ32_12360 [Burkholderiaceae bacterium]|jgi:hypothetical protein|nr:hypothetical protein [Burkholderiaceae bacterium]